MIFRSLLILLISGSCFAQPTGWMGKPQPFKWIFGIGMNAVDDDGRAFCQPFNFTNSWQYVLLPSHISIDRYINHGIAVGLEGNYNMYSAAKRVNDTVGLSGMFIAIDLSANYHFGEMIGRDWLDPYVKLGAGGTQRNAYPTNFVPTANFALGVNLYAFRNFGFQLQTAAKFGLAPAPFTSNSNYLQHSVSIIYRVVPREKSGSTFSTKKRYKWTNKKHRYKGGGGGK